MLLSDVCYAIKWHGMIYALCADKNIQELNLDPNNVVVSSRCYCIVCLVMCVCLR